MTKENLLEVFEKEYASLVPRAERMCEALERHLEQAVADAGTNVALIETRVKTWDSTAKKILGGKVHIRKLVRLQDLIGIRIVVLFQRDIHIVCDLLAQKFRLTKKDDLSRHLGVEKFGYQSTHCLIELTPELQSLPEFAECFGLQAEVQVRTLSQHMWAAASHKLQYKTEEDVPEPVKRSLNRVAAVLEIVDLEFERVLAEKDDYKKSIVNESEHVMLNVDNLIAVLDKELPSLHKLDGEQYSELLADLLHFGVSTRKQLMTLIETHLPEVLRLDRKVVDNPDLTHDWERLDSGVFYTYVGLIRKMLQIEFHLSKDEWNNYVFSKPPTDGIWMTEEEATDLGHEASEYELEFAREYAASERKDEGC